MKRDPIFETLSPPVLLGIVQLLKFNPMIGGDKQLAALTENEQLKWLDGNRSAVEDHISFVGSSLFGYFSGSRQGYREIVENLASKLGASFSFRDSTEAIEASIVAKIWNEALTQLTPEQKDATYNRLEHFARTHLSTSSIRGSASDAMQPLSYAATYLFGSNLLTAITGTLGVRLGATVFATQMAVVLGPIGWAALGLFILGRLGAPNYKKLLPVVILVATGRSALALSETVQVLSPAIEAYCADTSPDQRATLSELISPHVASAVSLTLGELTDREVAALTEHEQSVLRSVALERQQVFGLRPESGRVDRFEIENFRCFQSSAGCSIRPITLVFGPNSSGKSSLFKPLVVLKQTLDASHQPFGALVTNGPLASVGTFEDFIHGHDTNREFKIRFGISKETFQSRLSIRGIPKWDWLADQILVDIFFHRDEQGSVSVRRIAYFLDGSPTPNLEYRPDSSETYMMDINSETSPIIQLVAASFTGSFWSGYEKEHRQRCWELAEKILDRSISPASEHHAKREKRLRHLQTHTSALLKQRSELQRRHRTAGEHQQLSQCLHSQYEDLVSLEKHLANRNASPALIAKERQCLLDEIHMTEEHLRRISEEALQLGLKLSEGLERIDVELNRVTEEIDQLRRQRLLASEDITQVGQETRVLISELLPNFSSTPAEDDLQQLCQSILDHNESDSLSQSFVALTGARQLHLHKFLPTESILPREGTPTFPEAEYLGDLNPYWRLRLHDVPSVSSEILREFMESIIYLGPVRALPERAYVHDGNASVSVGSRGDRTTSILFQDPVVLQRVNQTAEALGLGYALGITKLGAQAYMVEVVDANTGKSANYADVGLGVSQTLPLIVQSLVARNKLILIEQPELHLHPKLQAELADLFIEASRSCNGNRFIIETHSEHLILRLQRRIREKTLSRDEIAVYYVGSTSAGSVCQEMRLDEEGQFIDSWPDGFFEESFREMFG